MNSFFSSFSSKAVVSNKLGVGTHAVCVKSITETNSFLDINGNDGKEDSHGWVDPCPQVLVNFFCPEKKAWFTSRLNGLGYKKYDTDLTREELASGKYTKAGVYAIDVKTRCRIVSDKNTEACHNIINQFFNALNMPEGSTFADLADPISEGRLMDIEIALKDFGGNDQLRVIKMRKHVQSAVVAGVNSDFEE